MQANTWPRIINECRSQNETTYNNNITTQFDFVWCCSDQIQLCSFCPFIRIVINSFILDSRDDVLYWSNPYTFFLETFFTKAMDTNFFDVLISAQNTLANFRDHWSSPLGFIIGFSPRNSTQHVVETNFCNSF